MPPSKPLDCFDFWELAGDGTLRCTRCDNTTRRVWRDVPRDRWKHAMCYLPGERPPEPPQPQPQVPSLGRRAINFAAATARHLMRGSPKCSQAQVNARLAICRSCEIYLPDLNDPAIGVCGHPSCGCFLTRKRRFLSKLRWKDSQCPLDKWPRAGRSWPGGGSKT